MDRAGLVVEADGPTNCGSFDVTFMLFMASSHKVELFPLQYFVSNTQEGMGFCFSYLNFNYFLNRKQLPKLGSGLQTPATIEGRISGDLTGVVPESGEIERSLYLSPTW
ncbi:hypothetical protein FCV25MIE_32867 [Fagus crenata]